MKIALLALPGVDSRALIGTLPTQTNVYMNEACLGLCRSPGPKSLGSSQKSEMPRQFHRWPISMGIQKVNKLPISIWLLT